MFIENCRYPNKLKIKAKRLCLLDVRKGTGMTTASVKTNNEEQKGTQNFQGFLGEE